MAVFMVSDPESEQELAWHLMLKNAWLCSSISSSFVGNNPLLQIHSFSEDRGKCNKTGNPSISDFTTILASHILILADSSYFQVMKPTDNVCPFYAIVYRRLATSASPTHFTFSTKFSFKA
jgi:hypothetical protein